MVKVKDKVAEGGVKDFYTTFTLIQEPWFPIKSTITVKKLIEAGRLSAVNISTNPALKRYRISRKSVEDFMEKYGGFIEPKKKKKR